MKSDRLLSALLLLQAHGRLSTRELAERLETSQRTAHRDMEALSAAGVPVLALRGAQGGWELAQGWRTKVPGLDDAELSALDDVASSEGISRSDVVRGVLRGRFSIPNVKRMA